MSTITDGAYDVGFVAGKADGFVTGYADGYEAATRSERAAAEEKVTQLLSADEALRREMAIGVGAFKADLKTPSWGDIVDAAVEYGKDYEYRHQKDNNFR